jgi:hypothetical protein
MHFLSPHMLFQNNAGRTGQSPVATAALAECHTPALPVATTVDLCSGPNSTAAHQPRKSTPDNTPPQPASPGTPHTLRTKSLHIRKLIEAPSRAPLLVHPKCFDSKHVSGPSKQSTSTSALSAVPHSRAPATLKQHASPAVRPPAESSCAALSSVEAGGNLKGADTSTATAGKNTTDAVRGATGDLQGESAVAGVAIVTAPNGRLPAAGAAARASGVSQDSRANTTWRSSGAAAAPNDVQDDEDSWGVAGRRAGRSSAAGSPGELAPTIDVEGIANGSAGAVDGPGGLTLDLNASVVGGSGGGSPSAAPGLAQWDGGPPAKAAGVTAACVTAARSPATGSSSGSRWDLGPAAGAGGIASSGASVLDVLGKAPWDHGTAGVASGGVAAVDAYGSAPWDDAPTADVGCASGTASAAQNTAGAPRDERMAVDARLAVGSRTAEEAAGGALWDEIGVANASGFSGDSPNVVHASSTPWDDCAAAHSGFSGGLSPMKASGATPKDDATTGGGFVLGSPTAGYTSGSAPWDENKPVDADFSAGSPNATMASCRPWHDSTAADTSFAGGSPSASSGAAIWDEGKSIVAGLGGSSLNTASADGCWSRGDAPAPRVSIVAASGSTGTRVEPGNAGAPVGAVATDGQGDPQVTTSGTEWVKGQRNIWRSPGLQEGGGDAKDVGGPCGIVEWGGSVVEGGAGVGAWDGALATGAAPPIAAAWEDPPVDGGEEDCGEGWGTVLQPAVVAAAQAARADIAAKEVDFFECLGAGTEGAGVQGRGWGEDVGRDSLGQTGFQGRGAELGAQRGSAGGCSQPAGRFVGAGVALPQDGVLDEHSGWTSSDDDDWGRPPALVATTGASPQARACLPSGVPYATGTPVHAPQAGLMQHAGPAGSGAVAVLPGPTGALDQANADDFFDSLAPAAKPVVPIRSLSTGAAVATAPVGAAAADHFGSLGAVSETGQPAAPLPDQPVGSSNPSSSMAGASPSATAPADALVTIPNAGNPGSPRGQSLQASPLFADAVGVGAVAGGGLSCGGAVDADADVATAVVSGVSAVATGAQWWAGTGYTSAKEAALVAGEPWYYEEWGCWLSACSTFYHDGSEAGWQLVAEYNANTAGGGSELLGTQGADRGAGEAGVLKLAVNESTAYGGVGSAAAAGGAHCLGDAVLGYGGAWGEWVDATAAGTAAACADIPHGAVNGWEEGEGDFFEQMHVAEGRCPAHASLDSGRMAPFAAATTPVSEPQGATSSHSVATHMPWGVEVVPGGSVHQTVPAPANAPVQGGLHTVHAAPASRWKPSAVNSVIGTAAQLPVAQQSHHHQPPPMAAWQPPQNPHATQSQATPCVGEHVGARVSFEPGLVATPTHTVAPRSVREACASSAGRPPTRRVAFGIGGRAALIDTPSPSYSTASPRISLSSIACLPHSIAHLQVDVATGTAVAMKLKSWPGPLSERSVTTKSLSSFVDARASDAQRDGNVAMAVLWQLLGVMVRHKGCLVGGVLSGKGISASAAVLETLTAAYGGSSCTSRLNKGFGMAVCGQEGAEAVQQVEALLLKDQKEDALRLAMSAQVRTYSRSPFDVCTHRKSSTELSMQAKLSGVEADGRGGSKRNMTHELQVLHHTGRMKDHLTLRNDLKHAVPKVLLTLCSLAICPKILKLWSWRTAGLQGAHPWELHAASQAALSWHDCEACLEPSVRCVAVQCAHSRYHRAKQ